MLLRSAAGTATAVVRCHVLPDAEVADGVVAYIAGGVGGTVEALASVAVHAK